jgi:nucleotide-binding universal stress UspA family protein
VIGIASGTESSVRWKNNASRKAETHMTSDEARRIIVGVTGSLANLAALHAAVREARAWNAPLTAVHAWSPPGGEIAYQRGPCEPLLEVCRQDARDALRGAFVDAFGGIPADVDVSLVIRRGTVLDVLARAPNSYDDLLVVGTGRPPRLPWLGRGRLGRGLLRCAPCAVLAVPPPDLINEIRVASPLGDRAYPYAGPLLR